MDNNNVANSIIEIKFGKSSSENYQKAIKLAFLAAFVLY